MGGDKRSQVQVIANGGSQRFVNSEKDPAIVDASGNIKRSAVAGAIKRPVSAQSGEERRELKDVSDSRMRFSSVVVQDVRMSFALFVETKFVPEHVQYKTRAGQAHYQAMLKHVLTPEAVSKMFHSERGAHARLSAVPGWPYLDGLRLYDLTPEHIRRIVAAADNAGYSPQTVKHIKNVCFAIVAHAQKEGCFHGPNPASLVKLPKVTRSTSPALSIEQVKTILNLLQYPHREAALFAFTTGLNLADICDLRWKHVNLDDVESLADGHRLPGRAFLVKAWWNYAGLGDSRACGKNKVVEIREPLLSALRKLRNSHSLSNPEDLVLISKTGDPIIPAGFWASELRRVAKLVGMPKLTWQDLRRTHHLLPAESLTQFPGEISWGNLYAHEPRMEAAPRQEVAREEKPSIDSDVRRISCAGRRLRISSGLGVKLNYQVES